jgi:hypothetical protein
MVIDLKNCLVYLVDGTRKTGAVNNMAGYSAGATTITVDGFTDQVPSGSFLTIDGVAGYQVVSTVETSSATTSITFTPGLSGSISDNDIVLVVGKFLRIKTGSGTINWNEKVTREYILDRGIIDTVRNGDEVPMDVSFTIQYEELTASTGDPPTPEDALKRRREAAAWESADTSDPCAPYCLDIVIINTPPNCTAVDIEQVTIPKFYYEELQHDPKAGTIQCNGKSKATQATVVRIPQ